MPRVKLFDEQEVLQKAIKVFWMQGYHATSMQDLVTHLGINRASLYDTFGDKKSLFLRAFQSYKNTNHERTRQFLHQHTSVKTGIQKLFNNTLQGCALDKDRKGCFIVNTATELIPSDEAVQKIIADSNAAFEQILFEYLQTGVASGELSADKDLKALAALFYTNLCGIQVISKANKQQEKLKAILKPLLSLLN